MKTVNFDCPHTWAFGKHVAILYESGRAGCPIHGWLLYTDVPQDAKVAMMKKKRGWKTIKDIYPPRIVTIGVDPSGKRSIFLRIFKLYIQIPIPEWVYKRT